MTKQDFLSKLNTRPTDISFSDTIATIEANYQFTECAFTNGDLHNAAGQNSGSCKIFAFAKLEQLNEEQTLHCFGDYYRQDVLLHPNGSDHQNIRNFMRKGWSGIHFDSSPLTSLSP